MSKRDANLPEVPELENVQEERVRPLRRAEYEKLVELGAFHDEKLELLYGALVEMSAIGPPHSSAVQKLTVLLVRALSERAAVRVQLPFAALDHSEPQPDFAVVPQADYDTEHPATAWWIIEVADSSLPTDRGMKQRLYAESGVPEYWVVNLVDRVIEVFTEPIAGAYTTATSHQKGEAVTPRQFPDVQLRVDDVIA
ncbi:MAG: Uma2 family endonuclease [Myxococcales bacterium]|nr:Uma2 family endonuclease [Myxococcales bacterium]